MAPTAPPHFGRSHKGIPNRFYLGLLQMLAPNRPAYPRLRESLHHPFERAFCISTRLSPLWDMIEELFVSLFCAVLVHSTKVFNFDSITVEDYLVGCIFKSDHRWEICLYLIIEPYFACNDAVERISEYFDSLKHSKRVFPVTDGSHILRVRLPFHSVHLLIAPGAIVSIHRHKCPITYSCPEVAVAVQIIHIPGEKLLCDLKV